VQRELNLGAGSIERRRGHRSVTELKRYFVYLTSGCNYAHLSFNIGEQNGKDYDSALSILDSLGEPESAFKNPKVLAIGGGAVVGRGGQCDRQTKEEIRHAALVGPDKEPRQWVEAVAAPLGLDVLIGDKTRRGDATIDITIPCFSNWGKSQLI